MCLLSVSDRKRGRTRIGCIDTSVVWTGGGGGSADGAREFGSIMHRSLVVLEPVRGVIGLVAGFPRRQDSITREGFLLLVHRANVPLERFRSEERPDSNRMHRHQRRLDRGRRRQRRWCKRIWKYHASLVGGS